MKFKRILLFMVIAGLVLAYFGFDLGRFLSLDVLKSQQAAIESWRAAQPLTAALIAFATYVIVTGLSLPGATVMSLAIGAIFGLFWGVILVSFASSIGATPKSVITAMAGFASACTASADAATSGLLSPEFMGGVNPAPKSVVTAMAGFAEGGSLSSPADVSDRLHPGALTPTPASFK